MADINKFMSDREMNELAKRAEDSFKRAEERKAYEDSRAAAATPPTDVRAVLNERGSQYGSFDDNARVAQALKKIWHDSPGYNKANDVVREGLDMILHKIARLCNGNPFHCDSFLDLAGYSTLVKESIERSGK